MKEKITGTLRGLGRSRATAAVAGAALVVLLSGGTAVATSKITTSDIQNGAVTNPKIANKAVGLAKMGNESVGTAKVINRSLGGWDIKKNSLGQWILTPALRDKINEGGEQGPQGEKGDQGEQGERGPQGPAGRDGQDGVSGYEVLAPEARFDAGTHEKDVDCPDGKYAIAGGYEASADGANGANTVVHASQATGLVEQDDGTWRASGWMVRFTIGGDATQGNMKVLVTCAEVN